MTGYARGRVGDTKAHGSTGNAAYLFGADGLLARLGQLVCNLLVVAEILLAANKNDGEALAEVKDLRDPLW